MQNSPLESRSPEILLLGGSGFVGSALAERFVALGWRIRLVTRTIRPFHMSFPCEQYVWDGTSIPPEAIEGVRAVINLAGQPIFDHAWTQKYRQLILDSRFQAGIALTQAIEKATVKPEVVIQISGTDYYGMDPRDEVCDEDSAPGNDFMAEVGKAGEDPALKIKTMTRLCIARMGLVLGWEGGGLPQLWDVYASGCGGVLGNGRQWMNWVHVEDVVGFCVEAISNHQYSGIYNLVAPTNSTNREFHLQLCAHTPSLKFLVAPALYLKALMGQRGNFLLYAPKVATPRAIEQGFTYQYPDLETAFENFIAERTHPSAHFLKVKQWVPLPISEWPPTPEFSAMPSKGLYRLWSHQPVIHAVDNGTLIEDRIEYQLPFFPLGQLALGFVRGRIQKRFRDRRETLATLALERSSSSAALAKDAPKSSV